LRKRIVITSFRFGVSQFTTWPWSFEQDAENYARLGVETIEVCESKLDDGRAEEQLAMIEERGLTVDSVQPAVRTLFPSRLMPEPEDPRERTGLFCRTIERVGKLASDNVAFVCNTGQPPNGDIQKVFDVAARECRVLADFAREHGARVALEPLNPAHMNVESAIWTLEQAMRIVETVDRDEFGVCVDLWNIWQNPDVVREIKACGERIFVVHVSDWRTPRSFDDRRVMGQGEIPLPPLLRALHEGGYRGAYTLEILSQDVPDSLWDANLFRVIEDSRTNLDAAWREAASPA
jgi:sugar phosphate isomerase/epimerase